MNKIMVVVLIFIFLFVSLAVVQGQQQAVGVKAGNWIEYNVSSTGAVPEAQDVTWAKITVLDVEGNAFHANVTVKAINGTISSDVRLFNFSAGNEQAWIIIPANLNPGQYFYDSSIGQNVTVQGQVQKNVAGANREITYTNTTERNKEWDKATGVYVASNDYLGNYTIHAQAYATNMWSPQILGLDLIVFYTIIVTVIVVVVIAVSVIILFWKKKKVSR